MSNKDNVNNMNSTDNINNVNVPISLAIEDMMKKLVDVVNTSSLPASIALLIVQGFLSNVRNAAQNEYDTELKNYQEQLACSDSKQEKK